MVYLWEVQLQLLTSFAFSRLRVWGWETLQLTLCLTVCLLLSLRFLNKPPTLLSTGYCTSSFLLLTWAPRLGFWGISADQSLFKQLLHQVSVWAIQSDGTHLATVIVGQTIISGWASCASCTTILGVHLPSWSFRSCSSVGATSMLEHVERCVQYSEVLHALFEG